MFKKIEIWILYLAIILFIIILLFYGAILRNSYLSGNKFESLHKPARFFSEIPHNIQKMIRTGTLNLDIPPGRIKYLEKPSFERFINTKRDALLILPRYDFSKKHSIIEIIDINNFNVIHTYSIDVNLFHNQIENNKEFKNIKIDDSAIRFEYKNPLILEDGSFVSHSENSPLFRADFCSKILWINDKESFHHSLNLDADNFIWANTTMRPFSKFVSNFDYKYNENYLDDAITKVNLDGEILYTKSITELLFEENIVKLNDIFLKSREYDPIHSNDIEPALTNTKYWKKNDLFISLRQQSAIIHFRPSTGKIINYIEGPFYEQHDVDIISDKEISIFNNNNSIFKDSKYSNVLIYNFETQKFMKKFSKSLENDEFKADAQGLSEILQDGSMLVEDYFTGRLLFYNKDGQKEWEFLNKNDKGHLYFLSWSRVIEDSRIINKIIKMAKTKKC